MEVTFKGSMDEFREVFGNKASPVFEPSELAELETADAIQFEHTPPLTVVADLPAADPLVQTGDEIEAWSDDLTYKQAQTLYSKEWANFVGFCSAWVEGFEETELVLAPPVLVRQENGKPAMDENGCPQLVPALDPDGKPLLVEAPVPQPDRLSLMKDLGQGQWPVPTLRLAYLRKSLQRMVEDALVSTGLHVKDFASPSDYLDYIDRVAAHMVQVSHIGFPDLVGSLDYSMRWRR